jgi:chemotaxis methyl-accepting protein methylase/PAS domain-containing protein
MDARDDVRGFFRDPEAWDLLAREVLPQLLRHDDVASPIRVWIAGCAAGEDVFTLAMLLAESVGLRALSHRAKIYATDWDEHALSQARSACYSAHALERVPQPFFEKYVAARDDGFVLDAALRRAVVFGPHDLVEDPPISRLDLLVCREALTGFSAATQARIVTRLAFSLRDAGILFLGPTLAWPSLPPSFTPLDAGHGVFRKDVPAASLRRDARATLGSRFAEPGGTGPLADRLEAVHAELCLANAMLETTNTELQSSNEELAATNEELQATLEEMHTINAELRAANEELLAANARLRSGEARILRSDALVSAVLGSLDLGVAVIGADMRLRAWNDRAAELWGLRDETSRGAPLVALDLGLPAGALVEPVAAVLRWGYPRRLELDAVDRGGRRIRRTITINPVGEGQPDAVALVMEDAPASRPPSS